MVDQEYNTFVQSNIGQTITNFTRANGKPCFTVTKANTPSGVLGSKFNLTFRLIDPKADTTQLLAAIGIEGLMAYNAAISEVSRQVLQELRNDPIIMHQLSGVIASYEHQEPNDAVLRAFEDEANAILRTDLAKAIIGRGTKTIAGA